ncbi:MAG TPA: hypothetical protein VNK24_09590 [Elusimicrobiota bacterium]|nr:hypothetical protein [Elusimicrobiota bacterium]
MALPASRHALQYSRRPNSVWAVRASAAAWAALVERATAAPAAAALDLATLARGLAAVDVDSAAPEAKAGPAAREPSARKSPRRQFDTMRA